MASARICGARRRRVASASAALVLVLYVRASLAAGAGLFDMGAPGSPLQAGYTRVTHETAYDEARGYGWLKGEGLRAFDRRRHAGPNWLNPPVFALTRDGVEGRGEMAFGVKVAAGRYRVAAIVGDIGGKVEQLSVAVTWPGARQEEAIDRDIALNPNSRYGRGGVHMASAGGECEAGILTVRVASRKGRCTMLAIEVLPVAPRGRAREAAPDSSARFDYSKSREAALAMDESRDPWAKALRLAALCGRLDVRALNYEKELCQHIERLLAGILQKGPANLEAARLLERARRFAVACDLWGHRYRRQATAIDLLATLEPTHVFHDKTLFNVGRVSYWNWRENREEPDEQRADAAFQALQPRYPRNRLVRMYLGERVPWGEAYALEGSEGAPPWAAKLREAFCRANDVVAWWAKHRQRPTGELGGGWGDDVEILRSWSLLVLTGLADQDAQRGVRRLVDGVWRHGPIRNGYSPNCWDVQHSAEPSSDSQPWMIGWAYGHPVYVERNMQTMKCMRDVWTAVNERGHRHFRSSDVACDRVGDNPKHAVDVPYAGRATKPGNWLLWYNRHPAVARLFAEWGTAWAEDILKAERGKPAGAVPPAIGFKDCRIGGYGPAWHDPDLYWTYFKWPGLASQALIYDMLLVNHVVTGDAKFLEPVQAGWRLAESYLKHPVKDPPVGSEAWAAMQLAQGGMSWSLVRSFAKARHVAGLKGYDELLAERGDPYTRFLLTGDVKLLESACDRCIAGTKFNFEFLTSEVLSTDRAGIGGVETLFSMLTGAVGGWGGMGVPSYVVTWQGASKHFAALVVSSSSTSARIALYSFQQEPQAITAHFWRLDNGTYELTLGRDADGDLKADRAEARTTFRVTHRGDGCRFELPPRTPCVVEIRQVAAGKPPRWPCADLAISPGDLAIERRDGERLRLSVTVRNIGSASAPACTLAVLSDGKTLAEAAIPAVPWPEDLDPKTATVRLDLPPLRGEAVVKVDPQDAVAEICEANNVCPFPLTQ